MKFVDDDNPFQTVGVKYLKNSPTYPVSKCTGIRISW